MPLAYALQTSLQEAFNHLVGSLDRSKKWTVKMYLAELLDRLVSLKDIAGRMPENPKVKILTSLPKTFDIERVDMSKDTLLIRISADSQFRNVIGDIGYKMRIKTIPQVIACLAEGDNRRDFWKRLDEHIQAGQYELALCLTRSHSCDSDYDDQLAILYHAIVNNHIGNR